MTATTERATPLSTGQGGWRSRRSAQAAASNKPGVLGYAFLGVVILGALFPLYWSLLIGSGDSTTINRQDIDWLPGGNFLKNAAAVVNNPSVGFWRALGNSIIVSGVVAFSVVLFSTLAGYAFAKLKFKGSRGMLLFIIATMAVPTQLGIVPLFIAMSQWFHLSGSLLAVIIPALVTAFGVFWMTQYLSQTLPDELIEAARVDGASMIRTFWHVGLPAAGRAAMLALFTFVATWTNFFWPFIILDSNNPTLPVALSLLQSNFFIDYSIVLAGVLLSTIPLLILFVVAGKQLVSGIMQGAVKG
jgi:cellobiose transport system permease protein